ncbi:MAG: GNAT family N-acetyltransferase [Hyphomicrobiales bacterium]
MTGSHSVEDVQAADAAHIELLLDASFGIDRRTRTTYRLREGNNPVAGLSLLIRDREVGISGAISFWPLKIGKRGTDALLLGPLAVHPERQNLGIGLALMREGLGRAKAMGHALVILVGDQPYYARVGFEPLPENRLLLPGPVDPKRFLYLELVPGALAEAQGLVLPPHRFAELSAALAVPHGANREQQRAEA